MYDLLVSAQQRNNYSAATKDGSYLTIRSLSALKFAILSILEYTGVVFLDNSFHQVRCHDPARLEGLLTDRSANCRKVLRPIRRVLFLVTSSEAFRGMPYHGLWLQRWVY